MPDVHAGAGCVIGFTGLLKDKAIPNLVGVDIGCGMLTYELKINGEVNFEALEHSIRTNVPSGFNVRSTMHRILKNTLMVEEVEKVCRIIGDDSNRHLVSIGTLGGGNHFIELAKGKGETYFLVVHSGSRNFGHKIATHFQKLAEKNHPELGSLAYLEGADRESYINCCLVAQKFATLSRDIMLREILLGLAKEGIIWEVVDKFETIHNYTTADGLVRKGAVSAQAGEKLLIPLNMRDGSLICIGKGNEDWNYSAPHGAGRIMSRSGAKKKITLEEFEESMKNVFSTCVDQARVDEAPMAYKNFQEIIDFIDDTADIQERIIPVYNYKG
jgi:RNA-splicing ligase RtcB